MGLLLTGHIDTILNLRRQPRLVLLGDVAIIALPNSRVIPHLALERVEVVRFPECLPGCIAAVLHARHFVRLEGVHGYGADEGDVYTEAAVDAAA